MDSFIKQDKLAIKSLLNLFLSLGFLAMLLTNLVLGFSVYQALTHKSRTLVPPVISKAFSLSDSQVDAPYLEQMADYFLYLKLNVTPGNVGRQYGQLLEYVDEGSWASFQPNLLREAGAIKKGNISSQFAANTFTVNLDALKVRVEGDLTKHVGKRALPSEHKWYQVNLTYHHGVLALQSIQTLEATDHATP